jgi:hypothetical protein
MLGPVLWVLAVLACEGSTANASRIVASRDVQHDAAEDLSMSLVGVLAVPHMREHCGSYLRTEKKNMCALDPEAMSL